MKLIYLDTSNFSLLSKTKVSEPQKYNDFVEKWKNNHYTLAFTIAHLDELLRLEFENERIIRFEVLEDLLPFKFENNLMNKEILSAFIEKNVVEASFSGIEVFPRMFSQNINNAQDLVLLKSFNMDIYREVINLMYIATETSWEANTQPTREKNAKLPRLSDLPTDSMTSEMKQSLEDILENMKNELPEKFQDIPKEFLDYGQAFVSDMMKTFVEKSDESGFREAFSEFVGAEANTTKSLKNPLKVVMENFQFSLFVNDFIKRIMGIEDAETIQRLNSLMNLIDCPGLWLGEQVKQQIVLAKDSKASNEKDIQHISHLPYVNVFITDKRIVESTKQVLRKQNLIESLRHLALPINVSNNLESLENALFI